jgi:hypothetical protein
MMMGILCRRPLSTGCVLRTRNPVLAGDDDYFGEDIVAVGANASQDLDWLKRPVFYAYLSTGDSLAVATPSCVHAFAGNTKINVFCGFQYSQPT